MSGARRGIGQHDGKAVGLCSLVGYVPEMCISSTLANVQGVCLCRGVFYVCGCAQGRTRMIDS